MGCGPKFTKKCGKIGGFSHIAAQHNYFIAAKMLRNIFMLRSILFCKFINLSVEA